MSSLISSGSKKEKIRDNPPEKRADAESPGGSGKSGKRGNMKFFVSLAIAMTIDALDVAFPVISPATSVVGAASLLFLWGWRWEILTVAFPESVVGPVAMFPTWTILVLYLGGFKKVPGKK